MSDMPVITYRCHAGFTLTVIGGNVLVEPAIVDGLPVLLSPVGVRKVAAKMLDAADEAETQHGVTRCPR